MRKRSIRIFNAMLCSGVLATAGGKADQLRVLALQHLADMVRDDEESVRKLVLDLFGDLWFRPANDALRAMLSARAPGERVLIPDGHDDNDDDDAAAATAATGGAGAGAGAGQPDDRDAHMAGGHSGRGSKDVAIAAMRAQQIVDVAQHQRMTNDWLLDVVRHVSKEARVASSCKQLVSAIVDYMLQLAEVRRWRGVGGMHGWLCWLMTSLYPLSELCHGTHRRDRC